MISSEIKKQITLFFALFNSARITNIDLIPIGFKNKSYIITDENGDKWVLKMYAENFLTKDQIEERARIIKQLEDQSIPVLEFIEGIDGNYTQSVENTYATLSKYVPVPLSESTIDDDMVILLASNLKRLHKGLNMIKVNKDFRKVNIIDKLQYFESEEIINHIKAYFQKDSFRKFREANIIEQYIEMLNALTEEFSFLNGEQYQLLHGDFNLSNFLIQDGELEKIFDFDEMIVGPKEYEVAISIYYLDYERPMYLDRLINLFCSQYYAQTEVTVDLLGKIVSFMKYRAFYRFARYFEYYQYADRPGEHFTKFQRIVNELNDLNIEEMLTLFQKEFTSA